MDGHERIDVVAEDGSYVGQLRHVAAEPESGRASGLVLDRNGSTVIVPLRAVKHAPGNRVIVSGTAADYNDMPRFERTEHRLLDHDFERVEARRLMAQYGLEDFEIGAEERDEALPTRREVHTGAENPYRTPTEEPGSHQSPIEDDPTDMDESNDEMRARTRSDMH